MRPTSVHATLDPRRGFSLLEVLIALAILGVLIAFLGSGLGGVQKVSELQNASVIERQERVNEQDRSIAQQPVAVPAEERDTGSADQHAERE